MPHSQKTDLPSLAIIAVGLQWALGISLGQNPNPRCDVVGVPQIASDGSLSRQCLDLTRLQGDTLVLPRNATRIAEQGLALCKGAVRLGGLADIAYVLDQSGSMYAKYLWVDPNSQDTAFLENLGGCTSLSESDVLSRANLIYEENGTQSVKVLNPAKNVRGCNSYAGDPYGQRGVAFRNAIQYQAELSPASTAGYIGFNDQVTDRQTLRVLNAANVQALKNSIVMRNGGTKYKPPLDTAKRWLNNSGMIQTPKQAIIFLSDGKPSDSYLSLLADGKMPPVYGIFLGNPNVDYSLLRQLADTTRGGFYLIPPGNPDSLKAVVKIILNEILKSYSPVSAILRNESLSPVQEARSLAGDFIPQGEASWRINLSDIVALNAATTNRMSLETRFRETQSGSEETRLTQFVLRTDGPIAVASRILSDSLFALSCYEPSRLTLLNGAGRAVTAISESDSLPRLRLRTAPENSPNQQTAPRSSGLKDSLSVSLANQNASGDSAVFLGGFRLIAGLNTASRSGALETRAFDTVTAFWRHPRDRQDTASVQVEVAPANRLSSLRFSLTDGGPATTLFPPEAAQAFLILDDQVSLVGQCQVTVTSAELGLDAETVNLIEVSPGHFQGRITLRPGVKIAGDNYLQVSPAGDQLRAVYRDSHFGDSAVAQAGFDQATQEAAQLVFITADGRTLPNGSVISPLDIAGLRAEFSDDFALGSLANKNAVFTISSSWGEKQVLLDSETIAMPVQSAPSPSRGQWGTILPLFESSTAVSGDGRLNFRFLGRLNAQVTTHDNAGRPENGIVTATLLLAYADVPSTMTWSNTDTSGLGGSSIEGLSIKIKDQDYAPGGKDSTRVQAWCPASGDSLLLTLKENNAGDYGPIAFGRNTLAADPRDAWLSCPDGNDIVIKHVDPIHGTVTSWILPQVTTPVANPGGREFRMQQLVTLATATPDARIYLTWNGSRPDTAATLYLSPISLIATTTLRAMASKPGYRPSTAITQTYTKNAARSRVVLLDANGNPWLQKTLFDNSGSLTVQVRTSQGGLSEVKPTLRSLRRGDVEEKRLFDSHFESDALVYQGLLATAVGQSELDNDTLNIAETDTLIATWINPLDAQDIASDTVFVKPRYYAMAALFSDNRNGSRISLYPNTQDSAYVVIDARPGLASAKATLTSRLQGQDRETVQLSEISSGHYIGAFPLSPALSKTSQNGNLEVALAGDQIQVVFVDPIYGDSAFGNAGFAQGVEETGRIAFVNEQGQALIPDAVIKPDQGLIRLRYQDDWIPVISALVDSPKVLLVLEQWRNGAWFRSDTETVLLSLDTVLGTLGQWSGSISLMDSALKSGDGKLQTAYLGKLTASLPTHDNAGSADGGQAKARLQIAYPDQPANIHITDEKGEIPNRASREILVTLDDGKQTLSGGPLQVKLSCLGTGDSIWLTLQSQSGSNQWTGTFSKGEGSANGQDAILTCSANDQLVTTYVDPVHGTTQSLNVQWMDRTPKSLYFSRTDDTLPILSLSETEAHAFRVHLLAASPNRESVDTLVVSLAGPDGETETLKVTETGAFTGHFLGDMPFAFSLAAGKPGDQALGFKVDVSQNTPFATLRAEYDSAKGSLTLRTQVYRLIRARISDADHDGKADAANLIFATALDSLPKAGITAYWNKSEASLARHADGKLLSRQGFQVFADWQDQPWDLGITAMATPQPTVALPSIGPWFGQEIPLQDGVGPIPLTAFKKPSDLRSVAINEFDRRFNPDTLIIQVSEPIKSSTSNNALFRFSSGCTGYDQSQAILTYGEPTSNPDRTEWTVLVDNSPQAKLPLIGDCLYLETNGRYTDDFTNAPSPVGVKLEGTNPRLALRLVQGYPPVAGVDAESPGFLVANFDNRGDRSGRFTHESQGNWNVLWVPPANFESSHPMDSYIPSSPSEEPITPGGEATFPSALPSHVSVVQVATTGRYVANISIFDNTGTFVRSFKQAFGYRGELRNPYRSSDKGMLSFLVWDMKDKAGAQVGQGVYLWKIQFTFADGKQQVQVIRTGVLRP